MDTIYVRHSSIIIPDYELGECKNIEDRLSIWNKTTFSMDNIGFDYDEENKLLRIPRGIPLSYISSQFPNKVLETSYVPDSYAKAKFILKVEPRNNIQRKSLQFILGKGEFEYTSKYSQVSLNLDTGDGKTYCVIASLTYLNTKAIIICPNDNIKSQWKDSLINMTSLSEPHICDIKSKAVVEKLMTTDPKKIKEKVFLINHASIRAIAKRDGWLMVSALFKHLEVGVKVYDEAHLNFHNMILTDLYTNTKKTIYLTANFFRSERVETALFNFCFKSVPTYGVETRNEKRKHIVYLSVQYDSKPSALAVANSRNRYGFDKNKYSDYCIENETFIDVVCHSIDVCKNYDGKILLLLSKIDAVTQMGEILKDKYPEKNIAIYHSKLSQEVKDKALVEADIIISIPKSLGTGTDIKRLRSVIMTEPYSSEITANQVSGRLREFSPTDNTFYIELVDRGFNRVYTLYKNRLKVFKKKCLKVGNYMYNK